MRRWFLCLLICAAIVIECSAQQAGGFSGGVTPSRFEIDAKAGDKVARSFAFYNMGKRPQQYHVRTFEWAYSAAGKISFQEELVPDSCRPWVRLERHKMNVLPSAQRPRKFRFEIHVPEDTESQECRFAIMIESLGEPHNTIVGNGAIALPTTGRLAVIVYLAIGDARPILKLGDVKVADVDGKTLPVIKVTNSGNAHGRLDGVLRGVDADDNKLELTMATSPIMPGQMRILSLMPGESYQKKHDTLLYPLRLNGKIYSGEKVFSVDSTIHRLDIDHGSSE